VPGPPFPVRNYESHGGDIAVGRNNPDGLLSLKNQTAAFSPGWPA